MDHVLIFTKKEKGFEQPRTYDGFCFSRFREVYIRLGVYWYWFWLGLRCLYYPFTLLISVIPPLRL